jgi:hypothetical protein
MVSPEFLVSPEFRVPPDMIRNLHDKLGIPAEALIRPSNLRHA